MLPLFALGLIAPATAAAPPNTVIVVVVDTTNRDYLSGFHPTWDTTPSWHQVWSEGTLFANTLSVRGLTSVAVSTIQTGTYPRTHGVRSNSNWPLPPEEFALLAERFHDAGYETLGYSANACQFLDRGFDSTMCVDLEEAPDYPDLLSRDMALIGQVSADLAKRDSTSPLFIWLHLVSPHDPYNVLDEFIDEFYKGKYTGALDPSDTEALDGVMMGRQPITTEEIDYVRATYAAELRGLDEGLGEFFARVDDVGRGDALVALGSDHGEELAEHNNYFYHGCSQWNGVMQVAWGFRGPGIPAGQVIEPWISEVDLAPTLVELAGLPWTGPTDGRSLVSTIETGELDPQPVFFERGGEAAGVISGDFKYFRDEEGGYSACEPYTVGHPYPDAPEWLSNLESDPEETVNLVKGHPATVRDLRTDLCSWVTEAAWQDEVSDPNNLLFTNCQAYLVAPPPVRDDGGEDDPRKCGCSSLDHGSSSAGWGVLWGLGVALWRRGSFLPKRKQGRMWE